MEVPIFFSKKRSSVYLEIIYNNKVRNIPETVTNAFASYFENIYTEKDHDLFDSNFKSDIDNMYDILLTCSGKVGNLPGGLITEDEVSKAILNLKLK